MNAKLLAVLWALFILALLSIPGPELPDLNAFGIDKVGHFALFFVGAFVWLRAWPRSTARVLAGGLVFAILAEVYQGLMPLLGRTADPFDVAANAVGLVAGALLWRWLRHRPAPVA
jgi:VanZ family protein